MSPHCTEHVDAGSGDPLDMSLCHVQSTMMVPDLILIPKSHIWGSKF